MHDVLCRCQVQLGVGTGVVGSLFDEKGFGFIVHHNQELDDVFFHFSEYPASQTITSGDEVAFECVQNGSSGKFKAQKIRILKKAKDNKAPSASYTVNKRNMSMMHKHRNSSPPHSPPHRRSGNGIGNGKGNGNEGDSSRPKLGCFKLVKKDVTDKPMYIPVFPLKALWKSRKQFV